MTESGIYFAEGNAKNPQIDFNIHTGDLILSGRSIPENAAKIYEPVLKLAEEYIKTPRQITNFRLNLYYFNSASMIWFARLVKTFARIDREDAILFVHLYFDQEDYDLMDPDEIRDMVCSLVEHAGPGKVSIGIKVYALNKENIVVKQDTILT